MKTENRPQTIENTRFFRKNERKKHWQYTPFYWQFGVFYWQFGIFSGNSLAILLAITGNLKKNDEKIVLNN